MAPPRLLFVVLGDMPVRLSGTSGLADRWMVLKLDADDTLHYLSATQKARRVILRKLLGS